MDLSIFLKENKEKRENVFYPACESFKDKEGNVINWEIKPMSTIEEECLREDSMNIVEGRGILNINKYIGKLVAGSIVYPNLYDAKLQDSYGVNTPEELLKEIVDKPAEYSKLARFVQELNGYKGVNKDIEKAKN